MGLINAALLLPYTVTFQGDKRNYKEVPTTIGDKSLILPLPTQLQQQPHASQALNDPDVPFEFAKKHEANQHKAPQVHKNIVDDRKRLDPKPQVATIAPNRDTIRRRRGLSVGHTGALNQHFKVKRQHAGNGSLFNAVNRAHAKGIVDNLKWVGCAGVPTDHLLESTRNSIATNLQGHNCEPVFIDDKTYVGHYDHYCKDILFPTLHCQVPEIPKSKTYEDQSWTDYQAVNRQIADKIIALYQPGDYIWVHDYHLMLVPQMVREILPHAPVAFFMHVAFPTSEVFRCLAHRADLLHGVLRSNSIGFQNNEYAQHFMMTSSRILAYDASKHCIQTPDCDVHIFVCPIGIDPERLNELKHSAKVATHRQRIRARWPNTKIIGARDKLDPTRGIVPKLKAYAAFLEDHPELASSTVLIQICLPSVGSENELEAEIASISDSINTKYGDIAGGIHPLVILRQDVLFEQYLALISEADAFAVTCLRDGMNLTCHEFVYCNERHGPLILSEFTGSASVFADDCVLVNPWDKNAMKKAFYNSLNMPSEEKKDRWENMHEVILSHTCIEWVTQCLEEMRSAWKDDQARNSKKPDVEQLRAIYNDCAEGERRFITFEIPSGNAILEDNEEDPPTNSKQKTMARRVSLHSTGSRTYFNTRLNLTLSKLLDDPKNIIYVSSAESRRYMERTFRQLPSLGLIAESGRYARMHDTENWIEVGTGIDKDWREELKPILERMKERLPVRSLDMHENTVVADFEFPSQEDEKRKLSSIGEYVSLIDDAFSEIGLRCRFNHNQLVVYPLELISLRTKILSKIITLEQQENIGPMILATQPLATHEDDVLFSDLLELQANSHIQKLITIICGNHPSLAKYRVAGINSLLTLLTQLSDE